MKYFIFITNLFLSFSVLCSCLNNNNKTQQGGNKKCLPAIVLIGYLGESNKPTYPLVIRTNENDTSYLEFIGFENEKFKKAGFMSSKEYYRLSTINPEMFFLLKNYIVTHNTHKDRTVFNADATTMKIVLYDKCDSVSYSVNKEDKGYFSKMIDILNLKNSDELWNYIHYYHEIQEWDGSQ
jgi:hypothetical protein